MKTCIEDTDPWRSGQKLLLRDAAADGRIFPELAEDLSINKRTAETRSGTARYRAAQRRTIGARARVHPVPSLLRCRQLRHAERAALCWQLSSVDADISICRRNCHLCSIGFLLGSAAARCSASGIATAGHKGGSAP